MIASSYSWARPSLVNVIGATRNAVHRTANHRVRLAFGRHQFEPRPRHQFVGDRLSEELLDFDPGGPVLERLQEHTPNVLGDVGGLAHQGVAAAGQRQTGGKGPKPPPRVAPAMPPSSPSA